MPDTKDEKNRRRMLDPKLSRKLTISCGIAKWIEKFLRLEKYNIADAFSENVTTNDYKLPMTIFCVTTKRVVFKDKYVYYQKDVFSEKNN